ncbi:MAG: ABC transporter ATP-binding protein [Chitinophagia bacterium]
MQPIISLQSVHKSYGTKQVLNGINLTIQAGQVIGYIGPNGAGKSTTVKILCGLIDDYEGTVEVAGINLRDDLLAVKRKIGYVPELAELYDVLTPREFLTLMSELYELPEATAQERILKMLQALGLEGQIDQRMDTFSKGMKQKVLIISGILHNPDIIILDEPLSGLDANSVLIIKDLISKLASEGKTIFYCSHMMDVVEKVSDLIVLIHQGTVIAQGTIQELQAQSGNNSSLEKIFAQLTSNDTMGHAASDLIQAIHP